MGVGSKRFTKKEEEIKTCPTLFNHLTENTISRRRLVTGKEKDLATQKKDDEANRKLKTSQREESFKTYNDSSAPSVKYTNRVYKSWEAREECNQNLESFKS